MMKFLEISRGEDREPGKAYIKNGDVVLVDKDNKFVTVMKGGVNNARIKNKRK